MLAYKWNQSRRIDLSMVINLGECLSHKAGHRNVLAGDWLKLPLKVEEGRHPQPQYTLQLDRDSNISIIVFPFCFTNRRTEISRQFGRQFVDDQGRPQSRAHNPASSERRRRQTRSVLLSTRMLQCGKSAQLFGPGVCRRPYDTAAFLPGLGGGKRFFSQWLTADIVEQKCKCGMGMGQKRAQVSTVTWFW